jgi:perosamine synthetase
MIPVSQPSLSREELDAVGRVFGSNWLGLGAVVQDFENALKEFLGSKYVVAVNTGTSALHLSLSTLGIGKGDEIILPSLTFVATAQAITALNATPVFCDVKADTLNIDPDNILEKITPRTKAIIPVHYRGEPCEMERIIEIGEEHGLRVIEDAAHSFGSHYKGKRIGSFGDITCFSFDPIKNITCGEGGAIILQDEALSRELVNKRMLGMGRDSWSRYREKRAQEYDVVSQGYRYHMSNINAAIGLEQIKKFDSFNKRKIEVAKKYDAEFTNIPEIRLIKTNYTGIGLFAYVIRVTGGMRDDLMEFLKKKGVGAGVHYRPVHLFSFYRKFAHNNLPVTEKACQEIITLPCFPNIKNEEVNFVIDLVKEFFSNR